MIEPVFHQVRGRNSNFEHHVLDLDFAGDVGKGLIQRNKP